MKVELSSMDVELIVSAMESMRESREDEIRWAGDDQYIVEADEQAIADIDDLMDRLNAAT